MTNDLPGENHDQSDVKDSKFSSLSDAALGHAIGLEYEGSMDIDYESFLIEKVVSLGNLDEETVQNLKLSSNTTFADPSGNVYSEKLAHYVEAFWNDLNEKERIILEEDLKEIAPLRPRIEEFKGSEFSEQLFESEEGINKFVGIIGNNLKKALLVSLLTGKECKYEIYKDNSGRYLCDSFPRVGDYQAVGPNGNSELNSICMIHTHPTLTDYDSVEKKFLMVDGFSYNPGLEGDLRADDRSDWVGFLTHSHSRGTVEGVLSSNEHLTLLKFNPLDVDSIVTKANYRGIKIYPEDIDFLNQEGVYTSIVARSILRKITNNSYSEDIDKRLSSFFGYNLYKGNFEKIESVK